MMVLTLSLFVYIHSANTIYNKFKVYINFLLHIYNIISANEVERKRLIFETRRGSQGVIYSNLENF